MFCCLFHFVMGSSATSPLTYSGCWEAVPLANIIVIIYRRAGRQCPLPASSVPFIWPGGSATCWRCYEGDWVRKSFHWEAVPLACEWGLPGIEYWYNGWSFRTRQIWDFLFVSGPCYHHRVMADFPKKNRDFFSKLIMSWELTTCWTRLFQILRILFVKKYFLTYFVELFTNNFLLCPRRSWSSLVPGVRMHGKDFFKVMHFISRLYGEDTAEIAFGFDFACLAISFP